MNHEVTQLHFLFFRLKSMILNSVKELYCEKSILPANTNPDVSLLSG